MDAGLKVRLNPDGGNKLNFREALRLYLAPIEQQDEQAEDDEHDENGDNEPRKNVLDDYDYEDDFIDDGEVIEDEVAATPPNEENDTDVAMEDQQQPGKAPEKPPVHHGFANFWVNTGNLPSKRVSAVPQPPSVLGNVVLEHVKLPAVAAEATAKAKHSTNTAQVKLQGQKKGDGSKPGEGSQAGGNGTTTSNAGEGSKKTNPTNSASASNAAKSNSGRQSQTKGKVVQQTVIEEIGKLATLCQTEFGDKKPKLSDPKVQEQLDVMFRAAIAAGVGKLFSDIAKDRRVVALADEVWNRLSFLRVKRANLETLGHALIWSAKEKGALGMVDKTENELEKFMGDRRGLAGGTEGALMAVVFDNEVDTRIYEWYRAKSELQLAKNQLGSRVKSVKKCVGGWVVGLKKTAFRGWSVAEGEIVEAFRRVEEVKMAQEKLRRENERQQREVERQRRESEKLEKKRKREEMVAAAAAAAKRAALEKSANAGEKNCGANGDGTGASGGGGATGNVGVGGDGSGGHGGSSGGVHGSAVDGSKAVASTGKNGVSWSSGGTSTGPGTSSTKGKIKSAKGIGKGVGQGGISKASGKNNVMKQFAKVVRKDGKGNGETRGAVNNKNGNKGASAVKNGGKVVKKRVTPVKIGRAVGKKDGKSGGGDEKGAGLTAKNEEKITGESAKKKGVNEGAKDGDKHVRSESRSEKAVTEGESERMEVIELD